MAVLLALMPFAADAAGLGRLTVLSGLGEPLNAEIELAANKSELSSLTARIAPPETYDEQGIGRPALLNSVRVELASKADGSTVLKLTTRNPINEPFLDMLVQVDWPTGRLLREYTTLLDPPGYGTRADAAVPVTAAREEVVSSGASEISPTPAASSRPESYVTKRGDSLSSVAKRMQAEDVSLEQMLVGLYRSNREAFSGNNMNQLKVGKIIRVPSAEELHSVSPQDAAKEVRVHAANWNAYRNKLAESVAQSAGADEEPSGQQASGKITSAAEDQAAVPEAGPRDVIKLSKSDDLSPGATADVGGAASAEKLKSLEEEIVAQEKALAEANERIAFFEKQVQDMQKLLQLQSQTMTALQEGEQAPAPIWYPPRSPDRYAPRR